jgi:hypothetical protein
VDWEYIYCRAPNSQDYYFDISANRYRIEEVMEDEYVEISEDSVSITEDVEISIALGNRQAIHIQKELKDTRIILGIQSVTPSHDKTRTSFSYNKQLPKFSPT